jgi:hypothetical protein
VTAKDRGDVIMKKIALALAVAAATLLSTVAAPRGARAEIGTADQVPAATLLLPYFEVALDDPDGVNTTFTVNNASSSAALVQVTLWTDEGIPTFNFNVYLTGYDVQQVNLRSLFDGGFVPVTGDTSVDPADTVSPRGSLSQDINFPGTGATCDSLYASPELSSTELRHIRTAHTGRRSAVLGGCAGASYGDLVARGYVTIDSVELCSALNPSSPTYFSGVADDRNILWGDYAIVHPVENSEIGSSLVHVESCGPMGYTGYVGNGAGHCPFVAGDYTFYGRFTSFDATDGREPLSTVFATRYVNGGTFSGGTDLLVWRDTKLPPTGASGKHNCSKTPAWFPLSQTDVVAFDEQENPTDLCFVVDNFSPAIGGTQACFPLATQRAATTTGNPLGKPLNAPAASGWLFLNLSHTVAMDLHPGVAQAWIETVESATGRFAAGFQAIQLDNALSPGQGASGVLIP